MDLANNQSAVATPHDAPTLSQLNNQTRQLVERVNSVVGTMNTTVDNLVKRVEALEAQVASTKRTLQYVNQHSQESFEAFATLHDTLVESKKKLESYVDDMNKEINEEVRYMTKKINHAIVNYQQSKSLEEWWIGGGEKLEDKVLFEILQKMYSALSKQDFPEAETRANEAMNFTVKEWGSNSQQFGLVLVAVSKVYEAQKKFKVLESTLTNAANVLAAVGHGDCVLVCEKIVALYLSQQKYEQAQQWSNSALSLRQSILQQQPTYLNYIQLADTLEIAGVVEHRLQSYDKAEVYFRQSVQMYNSQNLVIEEPPLGAFKKLITVLILKGSVPLALTESIDYLKKVQQIEQQVPKQQLKKALEVNLVIQETHRVISRIFLIQGRLTEAEKNLSDAVSYCAKNNIPILPQTTVDLATIYWEMGNYSLALEQEGKLSKEITHSSLSSSSSNTLANSLSSVTSTYPSQSPPLTHSKYLSTSAYEFLSDGMCVLELAVNPVVSLPQLFVLDVVDSEHEGFKTPLTSQTITTPVFQVEFTLSPKNSNSSSTQDLKRTKVKLILWSDESRKKKLGEHHQVLFKVEKMVDVKL